MTPNRRRNSFRDIVPLLFFVIVIAGALVAFVRYNTRSDDSGQSGAAISQPTTIPQTEQPPTANPQVADLRTITNARIQIPAAGINATIIEVYLDGESWDVSELGANAGHLQGTAWMSPVPGNIVLSGHVELRDGRKGIFARIGELNDGDIVILQQDGEERRYVVTEQYNTDPGDLTPVYPTTEDRLTLITCDDYDFFQDSYQERVIVVAKRIS